MRMSNSLFCRASAFEDAHTSVPDLYHSFGRAPSMLLPNNRTWYSWVGCAVCPKGSANPWASQGGIIATQATQGRSTVGCSSWYLHPFQHCCRPSQTCQHTWPKDQRNSMWLPTSSTISLAPSPHFRMLSLMWDREPALSTQPLFTAT